jgi:NhaA family Na+:H+ antiporter
METACENVTPPLHRLEYKLHPYVAYLIMPLFALANSGVRISGDIITTLFNPVSLGIILGLFLGKQIGIFTFSYLAVRLKFALFPKGASYRQIYGVACIGGIGFTMSLFVASLAFTNPALMDFAKLGILTGSLISGITGYLILRSGSRFNKNKVT